MPIRSSRKFVLVAILMVGLALAATVAMLLVVRADVRQSRDSLQHQQATIVQMQALAIGQTIAQQAHGLLYLSKKRNVRTLAAGDASQIVQIEQDFAAFLVEHPDYRSIALIDKDRKSVFEFDRTSTGVTITALPWSQDALTHVQANEAMATPTGKVFISPLTAIPGNTPGSTRGASIRFSTPMVDDDGRLHGAVEIEFSADRLLQELGQLNRTAIGRLVLLDNMGRILFDDDSGWHGPGTAATSADLQGVDRGLAGWARQHGSAQSEWNGDLLTQVKLCATTAACDEGDATKLAFLPHGQPWRLLRMIHSGDGDDLGILGPRYWPFLAVYLVQLTLFAAAAFFGIRLFATTRKLQSNERQLRRTGALIEAFVDNNPIAIFIKNRKGRYLYANRAEAARCNRDVDDLLGQQDAEFHSRDETALLRAEDAEVLNRGAAQEFTHSLRLPAGERHYTSFKFPLPDPEGGQPNIAAIETDITDRIKAEAEVERHAGILAAIFDAAPDGILFLDDSGRVESVNSSALRLFDRPREDVLGANIEQLIAEPAREDFVRKCRELVGKVSADSDPVLQMDEGEGLRKDGQTFPLEISFGIAVIGHRRFVICIARDVSQRKQAEAQLQRSQKMEAIGQLSGGMAHDFNNLLGVILGNLDILERALASNDEALKRIRAAQRAAERGADLNVRLLTFSRRQSLKAQPHDVNVLLVELIAMLPQTLGPDIRIVNKLGVELPAVLIDDSGFESALLNLAINARDAMPSGGTLTFTSRLVDLGPEQAAVTGAEVPEGTYVLVSVSDTGQGIDKAILPRVFEPFFSTKPRGKGTGLGLSMVYGFIKQSRGHTTIYSEVDRGTTVNLYLPVDERAAVERNGANRNRFDELPSRRSQQANQDFTILAVDDELGLLEVTVLFLREEGYRVLDAVDGRTALEICGEEDRIDLLLTDIVMPGYMNGVELATAVRVWHPSIQVLYMSGFPSSGLTMRTGLPVDGPVLNKPFSRHALLDFVQKRLGGGQTLND